MIDAPTKKITLTELERQHAVVLPDRELLITIDLLGIPIVGVTGINLSIS